MAAIEARDEGAADGKVLKADQVQLKYDSNKQQGVVRALAICVLFDMTGGIFLMPAFPLMVSRCQPFAKTSDPHPDAYPDPGISYAIAVAMFMAVQQFGQACSNTIFPPISDKVGRKPIIVLFCACGLIGQITTFCLNTWVTNYWAMIGCQFWLGLFGGTGIIAITYVNDMFPDPIDAPKKIAATNTLMGAISMSVNFGSLVGFAVVKGSNKLYYGSCVGIFCSLVSTCLALWIPGQLKSFKQIMEEMSQKQEKPVPTPSIAKKAILLIIVAMIFDSIGSQGLNTIRQNGPVLYGKEYMEIADVVNSTQIFAIVLGVPFAILVAQKTPGKGPVHACVFGNLLVASWQFVFLGACDGKELDYPGGVKIQKVGTQTFSMATFLVCVYASAMFNVWSMLQNDILVQSVAPPDKRGYWGGRARLAQNLTQAVAGLLWPTLLGDGTDRFQTVLIICASISIIAGIAYIPQYIYYIGPSKEKGITPEEIEELMKLGPEDFKKLSFVQQMSVAEAKIAKGEELDPNSLRKPWGEYKEEMSSETLPVWQDIHEVKKIIAFQNQQMIKIASNRVSMQGFATIQMTENVNRQNEDVIYARQAEKRKMGEWLGDMFEARGYDGWYQMADMYKIMLSNAFPKFTETPMSQLAEITVADVETEIIGAMKVMDMHAAMSVNTEKSERWSELFRVLRNPGAVVGLAKN